MTGLYSIKGPELDGLGYRTIPVLGKRPCLEGWQTHPSAARKFQHYNGSTNIGILLGGKHNLIGVDIDVRCEATAREIEGLLEDELGLAPKRIGEAPKSLFVFRCESPTQKRSTAVHHIKGLKCEVEVLGEGQQFVSHGIHPGTKQPYNWPNDDLTDYPINEIPIVTIASLNEFLSQAEAVLARKADFVFQPPPKDTWRDSPAPSNLNSEYLDQLKNGTSWHEPMLKLTARYVAKGLGKDEIMRLLEVYTWPGFTLEQTRAELGAMIDGAMKKDFAPKGVEQSKGLQVLTWSEISELLPPNYILKSWLVADDLSCLYGPSGSAKSFLVADICLHVAMGWPWNGYKVKQVNALYLAVEGGSGFINRVNALKKHYNLEDKDVPFFLYPRTISFSKSKDPDLVIETVQHRDIGLVVIDTLSQAMEGDENSAKDMGAFIRNMKAVQEATGAHVMVIHHTGKDKRKGERGSYALRGNLETVIEVSGDENPRMAKLRKQKDGEAGIEFYFKLDQLVLGIDADGDEITSCVVMQTDEKPSKRTQRLSDKNKLAMKALEYCLATEGVGKQERPSRDYPIVRLCNLNDWYYEMKSRSVTEGKNDDVVRAQRNRIKNKLMELGLIGVLNNRVWKVP